jgi:hypothetical protein
VEDLEIQTVQGKAISFLGAPPGHTPGFSGSQNAKECLTSSRHARVEHGTDGKRPEDLGGAADVIEVGVREDERFQPRDAPVP